MQPPATALAPLAMSQTKKELLTYLNMNPKTYVLMASEAGHVYKWLTSDVQHLKKHCKRNAPYSWNDMTEKSKDDAIERISGGGDLLTSYYWKLALPTEDCPNWIARWFLYQKFRFRDERNRTKVGRRLVNSGRSGSDKDNSMVLSSSRIAEGDMEFREQGIPGYQGGSFKQIDLEKGGVGRSSDGNARFDLRQPPTEEIADISSRPSGADMEHKDHSPVIVDTLSVKTSYTVSDTHFGIPTFRVPQRRTTEVQKILQWPAVETLLQNEGVDISKWQGDSSGTEGWLIEVTRTFGNILPHDRHIGISYDETGELNLDGGCITLNKTYIEGLCEAYFQSFHCICPILDRELFYSDTLPTVLKRSFSETQEGSSLVLLVLALGCITRENITGTSILSSGRDTGIRGTPERPPGLIFLNEAKRRFVSVNGRQCIAIGFRGVIGYVLSLKGELGLDVPGITGIQDSVPLPVFLSDKIAPKGEPEHELFVEYHFLAQITLKSLINRARLSNQETRGALLHERTQWPVAHAAVIEELSTQLENWRLHLPALITFTEDDLYDSKEILAASRTPIAISKMDIRAMLQATLRTRYKYAQYIIWRPYIYQILHAPRNPSLHIIESSLKALRACTMWPLASAAFQSQRQLVPHLYEYTHTITNETGFLEFSFFSTHVR
ncbi:hypothetical protein BP6252_04470 [Coleophoma cylindrospora]|uniref:Uncharacterized protein n=1 Tax=Coleophoma cylindrospora TaxID=1849047 RepID=A0A3D8S0J7_9HELO|nr:hypothetical protein BP6252_04470 [Coleophoma cylindrospora]